MTPTHTSRRDFLNASGTFTAGLLLPQTQASPVLAAEAPPPKKLRFGAVGLRYQGSVIAEKARMYGDIVALCDVDRHVREQARASFGSTPQIYEDYRDLLAKGNCDAILIATPDHWHTKMLIDSVRAGKDVYCEKPLTLTIDEGKILRDVVGKTDRVVQVGTWQRSDSRFRLAVEMVRQGRIGTLRKVTCGAEDNPSGGPFETAPVPKHFNWDLWQGQTPDVPYVPERSHYTFRWYYEYSGGTMTDWGAHHIDIAQWAINSYPVEISGQGTPPSIPNGYNVHTKYSAHFKYANGVEMFVANDERNGILFEGDQGRIFVNRGVLSGEPVNDLKTNPLPNSSFVLYKDTGDRPDRSGKLDAIINHMGNFVDCIQSRKQPISDIESQHRSVTTCHLANISIRTGRTIKWNPETEQIEGDPEAQAMQRREQRAGYEIV